MTLSELIRSLQELHQGANFDPEVTLDGIEFDYLLSSYDDKVLHLQPTFLSWD